jgi:hypothetical protein
MTVPLYALLIGADFYFTNFIEDGSSFESLEGCVRDIDRVEKELLLGRLKVPPENIFKLCASNTGADATRPPEDESMWPTYENIVAKFNKLIEVAEPGSQVYIHYSGHGGRASTIFHEIKPLGIDETLVPINIRDKAAKRYVRDVEMAYMLQRMYEKDRVVTVVLDSCHSGGMTRGGGKDVAVRGTDKVDRRERPSHSDVASHDELVRTFNALTANGTRGLSAGAGWLPEPQGYVLLAACRQNERAVEFRFDGKTRTGALTHWLLHALQDMSPSLTWKHVHERLHGKITSQFAMQTPQLYGEVARVAFGVDQVPPVYAVNVLEVDAQKGVRLNTGEALGTTEGAGFAVFPTQTLDFSDSDARVAVVKVTELGAADSWAEVVEKFGAREVEQGDQAVLIDVGVLTDRNKVRMVKVELPEAEGELPPPPSPSIRAAAFAGVRQALADHGKGFLVEGSQAETVGYQIAINRQKPDQYEILDPQGSAFEISPAIKLDAPDAAETVVKRVFHLYRYHTIQQLKNTDAFSPLAGKLIVEAFKAQPGAKSGQAPTDPQPLDRVDGAARVSSGDRIYLRIKNNYDKALNVALFGLSADWSITQIMPSKKSGVNTLTLEAGKEHWEVLRSTLSAGQTAGRDILRVVATIADASFRYLEMPALDKPLSSLATRGLDTPRTLVEQLLAAYTADRPRTRNFEQEVSASSEWTSAEVIVEVR